MVVQKQRRAPAEVGRADIFAQFACFDLATHKRHQNLLRASRLFLLFFLFLPEIPFRFSFLD